MFKICKSATTRLKIFAPPESPCIHQENHSAFYDVLSWIIFPRWMTSRCNWAYVHCTSFWNNNRAPGLAISVSSHFLQPIQRRITRFPKACHRRRWWGVDGAEGSTNQFWPTILRQNSAGWIGSLHHLLRCFFFAMVIIIISRTSIIDLPPRGFNTHTHVRCPTTTPLGGGQGKLKKMRLSHMARASAHRWCK